MRLGTGVIPKHPIFEQALNFVLKWEGGYTNNPNDAGGPTNFGITQTDLNKWNEDHGIDVRQSVRNITAEQVFDIYFEDYWNTAKCPKLKIQEGLPLVQFDTAVNMGVVEAIIILQHTVGVTRDGIFGRKTLKAVRSTDRMQLLKRYCDIREQRYLNIVDEHPREKVFLKGWLNRLRDLRSAVSLHDTSSLSGD